MTADNVLATIVAHKRDELRFRPATLPQRPRPLRDFRAALARPGARFILECKRASPSSGRFREAPPLAEIIGAYRGVADAVSVLTDQRFFDGSLADLEFVSRNVDVPVLRKDFILDPFQVREAHAHGADAVLLMLSVLDDAEWRDCASEARRLGLGVLTEVHDDAELDRALALDAAVIGINNRAFRDLSVNLEVTHRLAPRISRERVIVCESGIRDHADVRRLAGCVDAFLVGTALMRAPRIDLAARELANGAIKICGLTRAVDARAAWLAGARWGGVVFHDASPRCVDIDCAREIAAASPLPLVGVFVNAKPERVARTAREVPLAAVQLHGDESEHAVATLRAQLPAACGIWKALRVRGSRPRIPAGVDRVIFDSNAPGSGCRFDWSLLPRDMHAHGMAGGIAPGNVAAALATGAALLDVNSGVEDAPGIKSAKKLDALFNAVRKAVQQPRPENVHE